MGLVIGAIVVIIVGAAGFWLWSKQSKSRPGLRPGKKRKSGKLDKHDRALLESASKGDTEGVRDALKHAVIEACGKDKRTALHLAASRAHDEVTKLLIDRGAEINAKDRKEWTPLHLACSPTHSQRGRQRFYNIAELLLDKGANVNSRNFEGVTPLQWAVRNDRYILIDLLLDRGANLIMKDNEGYTALFWAQKVARRRTLETVAIAAGDIKTVKELIRESPLGKAAGQSETTPLHSAVKYGQAEIAQVLLEAGAKANDRNSKGLTPLHMLCGCKAGERIGDRWIKLGEHLLKAGAKVNAREKEGNTPLILAAQNDLFDLMQLILENGGNITVNMRDKAGRNAIHWLTEANEMSEASEELTAARVLAVGMLKQYGAK